VGRNTSSNRRTNIEQIDSFFADMGVSDKYAWTAADGVVITKNSQGVDV
jgi:hypothetical protein